MLRFSERIGGRGDDLLAGSSFTVTYGLQGDDGLTSGQGTGFSYLIGGSGRDVYGSRAGTTITIRDGGGSPDDVLVTEFLGPGSPAITALVDGRHLVAADEATGEAVFILDFLDPANVIEEIDTPDGIFSTAEFFNLSQRNEGYLGNVRWEDLDDYGFVQPYSTAEINEAIVFYANRSAALENPPAAGDAGSVYRFFNERTGSHFYTASLAERDAVFQALPQFRYEGEAFDAATVQTPDTIDVYRFFNERTGSHFYTASAAERDLVDATLAEYRFEGTAYDAYDEGGGGREALYRFFNRDTGTHFYTASEAERDQVAATLPQYAFEGVAYYVDVA